MHDGLNLTCAPGRRNRHEAIVAAQTIDGQYTKGVRLNVADVATRLKDPFIPPAQFD